MKRWVAAGAVVVVALGVTCASADNVPISYGQAVFSASADVPSSRLEESGLLVTSCTVVPDGLEVRGSVSVTGGSVQVAVSPADPTRAGVGVGLAFAAQTDLWPDSAPGDFVVVIPWADRSSRFTLVGHVGSAGVGCPSG